MWHLNADREWAYVPEGPYSRRDFRHMRGEWKYTGWLIQFVPEVRVYTHLTDWQ